MRIDHLQIQNFKGFADRNLDFARPVNAPDGNGSVHVIIGENGSGKTTALDALAVALGIWHVGIGGYGWRNVHESEVRITSSGPAHRPYFLEQVPVRISVRGKIGAVPLKWSREVTRINGRTLNGGSTEALSKIRSMIEKARNDESSVVLPLLAYYGAGRLWTEGRPAKAWSAQDERNRLLRLWSYKGCLDSRSSVRDLNQWLLENDWESYQSGREAPGYRLVKEAILRCLPGARELHFSPTRKEAVVTIEGRGEQPFSNLSDGQRNIMALVGDLAVKAIKLNYGAIAQLTLDVTPGVVLIDEIDLHLHPKWQRVVLENLRATFPNVQFIATTHSPFIVQALHDGELRPLEGQSVPKTENLGLETISRGLMDVKRPDVGPRYREMVEAAKTYLITLDEAAKAPEEKLAEFEQRLAKQIEPYADNPAFQAFLELKHETKLGHASGPG